MKVNWKKHKNKIGIYCIINLINNKRYIGKSVNIPQRIANHICSLNRESSDSNRYLISSWKKYGKENFTYIILEEFENMNENLIKEKELYWINFYNTTNSKFGYNLRMDSSTNMIVHEQTRKLLSKKFSGELNPNFGNKWSEEKKIELSKKIKKQYKNGRKINKEYILKGVEERNRKFLENPLLKEQMCKKVTQKRTEYNFYKYDKTGNLIESYDSMYNLLKENPTYKRHNIYAVCSGEKPSMYGFVWRKQLINDKVHTKLKDLDKSNVSGKNS